MRVAVVGASPKRERYSNQAVRELAAAGHEVVPVTPRGGEIEGIPAVADLDHLDGAVDTVTLYVQARISDGMGDALEGLGPRRVIFNPGTENPDLAARLARQGVEVLEACTLVMLRTGQF
jgi:predicted CoA-binding protein